MEEHDFHCRVRRNLRLGWMRQATGPAQRGRVSRASGERRWWVSGAMNGCCQSYSIWVIKKGVRTSVGPEPILATAIFALSCVRQNVTDCLSATVEAVAGWCPKPSRLSHPAAALPRTPRRRSENPCAEWCGSGAAARPLSPTAWRAAFMRLVRVDSETIRPFQTEAIRSSLLTTRSRVRSRNSRRSKTSGSTGTRSAPRRNSRRPGSRE